MKDFCPIDRMKLRITPSGISDKGKGGLNDDDIVLKCPVCGYQTKLAPETSEDSLILKTVFNSGSSAAGASSGVGVNEFTMVDPTLPHIKTLRCPNDTCASRSDAALQDVIYIKTDPTNLSFHYICTVCKTQWTS